MEFGKLGTGLLGSTHHNPDREALQVDACIHHKICEGRCQRSWCEAFYIGYTPLERNPEEALSNINPEEKKAILNTIKDQTKK